MWEESSTSTSRACLESFVLGWYCFRWCCCMLLCFGLVGSHSQPHLRTRWECLLMVSCFGLLLSKPFHSPSSLHASSACEHQKQSSPKQSAKIYNTPCLLTKQTDNIYIYITWCYCRIVQHALKNSKYEHVDIWYSILILNVWIKQTQINKEYVPEQGKQLSEDLQLRQPASSGGTVTYEVYKRPSYFSFYPLLKTPIFKPKLYIPALRSVNYFVTVVNYAVGGAFLTNFIMHSIVLSNLVKTFLLIIFVFTP